MVDRGFGRTERRESGQGRLELGRRAKAQHRDVREPSPFLRLVDPDALQPLVEIACQPPRTLILVREDEHGDAACLPVAQGAEDDGPRDGASRCFERFCDAAHVLGWAMSEEGKRDVEVAKLDEPGITAEGIALPLADRVPHVCREREATEDAQTSMSAPP